MKKLARLAGLLSLAVFAVGLMAVSSASATGYLLLPVGATIEGTSLPGTLSAGGKVVECKKDNFTATIASVHLIGPFVVHFLECTATGEGHTCPANSPGAASELILTTTLHALIGLALPGNTPALLILPTSGKRFVTFRESTIKEGTTTVKCTPETTVTGSVGGLLLQGIGVKTTRALLDFVPEDPRKIDLPLESLNVTPQIEAFGFEGKFETQVHLSYSTEVELMP